MRCLCRVINAIYKTNKSGVFSSRKFKLLLLTRFYLFVTFLAVGQMVFGINTYVLVLKQNCSVSYSTWLKPVSSVE